MRLRASSYINLSYCQALLLCPGGKKSSSFLLIQSVTIADSKAWLNIFFRRDTGGVPCGLIPVSIASSLVVTLRVIAVASCLSAYLPGLLQFSQFIYQFCFFFCFFIYFFQHFCRRSGYYSVWLYVTNNYCTCSNYRAFSYFHSFKNNCIGSY